MTDKQRRLIELSKLYEIKKEEMSEISNALTEAASEVVKECGVGGMFQDTDGTVFRVAKPTGTFVAFKEYIYERTRRHPKERPGISLKDAREAGFEVE